MNLYELAVAKALSGSGGGGGGSSYTLLAEADFEANTTSTTKTDLGNITLDSQYFSNGFMLYICIRDKAGRRTDYNVGTDTFIYIPNPKSTTIVYSRLCFKCTSSGTDVATTSSAANGVYVSNFNKSGMNLTISAKYNSTYSGTINGTYHVAVYALEWPGNVSPFVAE